VAEDSFSGKRGYSAFDRPIEIRDAAPAEVRAAVPHFAAEVGLPAHAVRSVVLETLCIPPDPQMWSSPNYVLQEAHQHLTSAEWFEVYDVAEALYREALALALSSAERYAERVNRLFLRLGVGWKLENGAIEARGSESFELQVARARTALDARDLPTARQEVHEALLDLSRRPTPDLTGAVQHAAAAMECIAREITGAPTLTLGDLLKRNPQLFPQPLGSAFEKVWGFASERARHLREGGSVDREEAELVVTLAAAAITYLLQKHPRPDA
jgi:hypothetical protein